MFFLNYRDKFIVRGFVVNKGLDFKIERGCVELRRVFVF